MGKSRLKARSLSHRACLHEVCRREGCPSDCHLGRQTGCKSTAATTTKASTKWRESAQGLESELPVRQLVDRLCRHLWCRRSFRNFNFCNFAGCPRGCLAQCCTERCAIRCRERVAEIVATRARGIAEGDPTSEVATCGDASELLAAQRCLARIRVRPLLCRGGAIYLGGGGRGHGAAPCRGPHAQFGPCDSCEGQCRRRVGRRTARSRGST
mmetsp:Transcript_56802/g.184760  ORF Transcript_56802/g.184760 Transcript_56802/m.184760 type:complete len:212 (+) Transcript_56802:190-825(+)